MSTPNDLVRARRERRTCVPVRRCADLVIAPMSFLDARRNGLQAGEGGTIREDAPAPVRGEVRIRELRCEETHGRPEGEPHPCQRFTPIPALRIG